jgi:hypothetical protein
MIARWIERCVLALLAIAIATDGTLIIRARAASRAAELATADSLRRPGSEDGPAPAPYGYTTAGEALDIIHPDGQTGWAIRYAAKGCEYCRSDFRWGPLASQLENLNYQVVVLLPSAKDAFSEDTLVPQGALQEAYPSMDWIKRFRLTVTPTLLIFGPDRQLIWHRQGMLSPTDSQSVLRAIEAAGAKKR